MTYKISYAPSHYSVPGFFISNRWDDWGQWKWKDLPKVTQLGKWQPRDIQKERNLKCGHGVVTIRIQQKIFQVSKHRIQRGIWGYKSGARVTLSVAWGCEVSYLLPCMSALSFLQGCHFSSLLCQLSYGYVIITGSGLLVPQAPTAHWHRHRQCCNFEIPPENCPSDWDRCTPLVQFSSGQRLARPATTNIATESLALCGWGWFPEKDLWAIRHPMFYYRYESRSPDLFPSATDALSSFPAAPHSTGLMKLLWATVQGAMCVWLSFCQLCPPSPKAKGRTEKSLSP